MAVVLLLAVGVDANALLRLTVRAGLAVLLPLAIGGCAVSGTFVRPDVATPAADEPAPDVVDTRLLLIGDAGMPRLEQPEPVFLALAAEAARLPDRTWVIFLGDNIYPNGLPPAGKPDRALAERRLRAQIDAVLPTAAHVIFVPGNHDYYSDGWPGLQRQRAYIEGFANPRLQALPAGGCPGPEVVDAGTCARLVFLDSQRWLQGAPPAGHGPTSCACDADSEITAALHAALASAGERRVVVMAHHPLLTHGGHGGFFTWRQHIFPLVDLQPWAWLPLPLIGSAYPLARQHGITAQDLSSEPYTRFARALRTAFADHPPLLYASGHEHTLQVLGTPAGILQLVSGSGTVERPNHVGRGDDTLLASSAPGFARLDLLRDGRAWLQVVEVSPSGPVTRPLALWLPR